MSFSGLGAVSGGYMQGQNSIADLQAKQQQIQQGQMLLDQKKRELAAQASLFQGLPAQSMPPGNASPGQPIPQQGPQPPMPGQSSQPQGAPGGQPMGGGMVSPPVQGPGVQMPPSGPPGAPQAGPPPGGMQQPQQGGGQPQGADLSPQGQLQIIAQIAQSIKQRSPGIDSQTLFEAVKQQIALMGQVSATQKQQLILTTDQLKAQVQTRGQDMGAANVDKRVAATERGQDIGAQNVDKRVAASIQETNTRIADADTRLQATQQAINARQDKSLAGRATNKAQTERLALLRSKTAQAKQQLSAAVASGDQSKIDVAQKGVETALQQVTDFQTKVVGGTGGSGPAGGKRYKAGDIIQQGGKSYRVTGGDPADPDVVEVP